MKVSELCPGILLEPLDDCSWVEVPWRGTDGSVIANYLIVVPDGQKLPDEDALRRKEPVLYLGTNSETICSPTPGNQVVLAWGKKMTVNPHSWSKIDLHC